MKTKSDLERGAWRCGRGFTLIEILIVVGIIIIIATIGIMSYGSAKKNIELDLQADNVVATLHSLRSDSQKGVSEGGDVKCYGIKFQKNDVPQKFQAPYVRKTAGCGPEAEFTYSQLDASKEIVPSAIILGFNPQDSAAVIFVPPYGTMQIRPSGAGTLLEITLSPKNDPLSKRIVEINSEAGKVGRKN